MSVRDSTYALLFLVLAAIVWTRDTTWLTTVEDALPILVAIPLFVWLGWPWTFRQEPDSPLPLSTIGFAVVAFLLGIVGNFTFFLALGWSLCVYAWLSMRLTPEALSARRNLFLLLLLAFPWVTLDGQTLGWQFRLSGACATEWLFELMGTDVTREGTFILVQNLRIAVDESCSGLNALQSMLIAGVMLAWIQLGPGRRFWWNLPLLLSIAWLANTLRIVTISGVGLWIGPEFAKGLFHTWGGVLILALMFALCWLVFSIQRPKPHVPSSETE